MKKILIAGGGRSSAYLIRYMLDHSTTYDWQVRLGDFSEELAKSRIQDHPRGHAFQFDVTDQRQREEEIKNCDIVISMLPPEMHNLLAADCIQYKKNMVTASYVSKEIENMREEIKNAGIILLSECGLDPGIDHMSAVEIIQKIKGQSGNIIHFSSYTGGLIAPAYNDNPWAYKFTWNPKNVILAGQGTARYMKDHQYRYIPYNRIFSETQLIEIENLGTFEGYANRDSLSYRKHYGLEDAPGILRGTLRMKGFCEAWNVFVKLGLTDDSYEMENSEMLSYREIIEAFLPQHLSGSTEKKLSEFIGENPDSEIMKKIIWTGLLEDKQSGLPHASPAKILQDLLEKKWKLQTGDQDMVVMHHHFEYEIQNKRYETHSSLVVIGEDANYTAMAKTVGLPMAIAAKLILEGEIQTKGLNIPVLPEIYRPILRELKRYGITFNEKHMINKEEF